MIDGITLGSFLGWIPSLAIGLVVLLIGFIIAKILEKVTQKVLKKFNINQKISSGGEKEKVNIEKIISKVVFFAVLLLAFIIFFNIMNLNAIASPFLDIFSGISGAVLSVLKAGVFLLIAWVIALLAKKAITMVGSKIDFGKMMAKIGLDEEEDENSSKWVENTANVVFYLILLLFMPAILDALGLRGISGPFEGLLQSFLNFIPKLVGAAIIFVVGYFIAKIIRIILTKFLQSIGTEKVADKLNLSKTLKGTSLSNVIGTVVFVFIMIPVTISALEALDLRGISGPAIEMLNDIITMLPKIVVAVVLILVGIWLAKWVKGVVVSLLENVGLNSLFEKMGVRSAKAGSTTPAEVVGMIVQILIIFLFAVEALQIVNLHFMVGLATGVFAYLPMVLAAIVILAVGYFLATLAERFVGSVLTTSTGSPHVLRYVAKYAIMAFALFMALDQLGIARSIISSAFILILGGVALAFGLAFGLGGREHASRYLTKMENSLEDAEVSKEDWEKEKSELKQEAKNVQDQSTDEAPSDDRYGNPFGDPFLDDENQNFEGPEQK